MGAILAAGLDGIERNLDPGEPLASNPHDLDEAEREARGIHRYPTSLTDAVDAWSRTRCSPVRWAPRERDEFIGVRRAEWSDPGRLSTAQQIAAHFRRY